VYANWAEEKRKNPYQELGPRHTEVRGQQHNENEEWGHDEQSVWGKSII